MLYPTFEGNVQDGTVIDRHGNPDLLLEFAEQYFKLFRSIMPTQSVPNSLIELMPALHLSGCRGRAWAQGLSDTKRQEGFRAFS